MISSSKYLTNIRLIVLAGFTSMILLSCGSGAYNGKVVAVEAGEFSQGSYDGAKLISIDIQKPGKEAEVLSPGFESAAGPAISYDGRFLFFQGKKAEDRTWQIWVTDLKKGRTSQVTELPENCIQPVPLPDGTVIFSREATVKGKLVFNLNRCRMDGTELMQITFNPAINVHASVLQEGRVLYSSGQQYPEPTIPSLMVMRPDGTKSEIYHRGTVESFPVTGGTESKDGYVYFTDNTGRLSRVSHRRPLHTLEHLSEGLPGRFSAVYPMEGSRLLVAYQPSFEDAIGLYIFDADSREIPAKLYEGSGPVTDPVLINVMEKRPMKLPSAVNPDNPTGLLMSQDINHSMMPVNMGISGDLKADRIRVSTLEGELAVVEVKEDGSFYLKVDADIPLQIETLNSQGEILRGPSDWIYLRPNERRACVGCHADPELAPENIQPLAVKEDPVVLHAKMKETSN